METREERAAAAPRGRVVLAGRLPGLADLLLPSFDVEAVGTARAAAATSRRQRPRLVVVQAGLQGGAGLVTDLGKAPETRAVPVVVLPSDPPSPHLASNLIGLAAAGQPAPRISAGGSGTELAQAVEATARARSANPTFGVRELADTVGVSARQLRRRLCNATGETPSALLRRMRLERAVALLEAGGRVKEVAFASGFGGLSTFRNAFRKRYGVTPSAFARPP